MAKILIIDDDEGFCEAMGIFLRIHGHDVITAMDGRAGLEAARQHPDLIICDLAMPALGGQDVLMTLRQDPKMEEVPFLFVSGGATREDMRESMNLGGDDFIMKPASPTEILAAVNSRLQRRQRQQQRHAQQVEKAVQLFAGIVDDLGSPAAAMHWLAEAAAGEKQPVGTPAREIPKPDAPKPDGDKADALLVTKDNRQFFVKLSEIKALTAEGEYSRAFWGRDQNLMFRKTLKQWQAELPPKQFLRIHRKAIINLSFLEFIKKTPNGRPEVHLKDFPIPLEVSHRQVPSLNRTLKTLAQG